MRLSVVVWWGADGVIMHHQPLVSSCTTTLSLQPASPMSTVRPHCRVDEILDALADEILDALAGCSS
eukprot:COSAG01_NODE_285_length_19434_cov_131.491777_4_plen_67_part_00